MAEGFCEEDSTFFVQTVGNTVTTTRFGLQTNEPVVDFEKFNGRGPVDEWITCIAVDCASDCGGVLIREDGAEEVVDVFGCFQLAPETGDN